MYSHYSQCTDNTTFYQSTLGTPRSVDDSKSPSGNFTRLLIMFVLWFIALVYIRYDNAFWIMRPYFTSNKINSEGFHYPYHEPNSHALGDAYFSNRSSNNCTCWCVERLSHRLPQRVYRVVGAVSPTTTKGIGRSCLSRSTAKGVPSELSSHRLPQRGSKVVGAVLSRSTAKGVPSELKKKARRDGVPLKLIFAFLRLFPQRCFRPFRLPLQPLSACILALTFYAPLHTVR